jgi:MarR family transcriptional regulator, organic hydroperoxide resistance regulator
MVLSFIERGAMMNTSNGGFLISQVKQIQGRVFEKLLISSGIEEFNGAQGRILYVLWQEDNLPIVELSKRTGLAKTTLTGMLDRLVAKGHVERTFDAKDRRLVRIVLTPMAHSLYGQYLQVSAKMNELFYAGFTDEEIISFESMLQRLLSNLTTE